MKINKKALTILAGLTVGMSSTAFAVTADSFTDGCPEGPLVLSGT